MVLSTAARQIRARSKRSGRVVVRGGRIISGKTQTINQKLASADAARAALQTDFRRANLKTLQAFARVLGAPFDRRTTRTELITKIQKISVETLSPKTKKVVATTVPLSKIPVEGGLTGAQVVARERDSKATRVPFTRQMKEGDRKKLAKDLLRQELQISGAERGIRAIIAGGKKTFGQRLADRFSSDIEKRRKESARVSIELGRKEALGKRLTARERAAKTAAGLQNVGIEVIAGLGALPVALARPKLTLIQLKRAVSNPRETLTTIGKEIVRNPTGFIANWIGTGIFLKGFGTVLRTSTKVAGKSISYTIKGGKNVAKGSIKLTGKGASGVMRISRQGVKAAVTKARNFKVKGKRVIPTKQLSTAGLKKLALELDAVRKTIRAFDKITRGKSKAVTAPFKKTLKSLMKKEAAILERVNRQGPATVRDAITKAQRQAIALNRALQKKAATLKKVRLQVRKFRKGQRRVRLKKRRADLILKGKGGRKLAKEPFRRRNKFTRLKKLKQEAIEMRELKGKPSPQEAFIRSQISEEFGKIKIELLDVSLRTEKALKALFRKSDRAILKKFKKGKLGGCK